MKIKKGDTIFVTSGKDQGRQGKIERVFVKDQTVLVTGLNIAKKHLKSQGEKKPGGIVEIAQPLPLAKVALVCPKCHQPTRVGFKVNQKGKHRFCKKCQEII